MHELMKSLKDHSDVPSTFDGQMPEYAFNADAQRILVGERYLVTCHDGIERAAEVTAATLLESERVAYCGVQFEDGQSAICTMPLSAEEFAAWKRHPDTFFGVVGQPNRRPNSPIEIYDILHDVFRKEAKERLLDMMANQPDSGRLAELDQPELASIYAERMANATVAMRRAT